MVESTSIGIDERQLLDALSALEQGDFTRRLPTGAAGTAGEIAATVNALLAQCEQFASEFNRITREIGDEGRFGGQAEVEGLSGEWKLLIDNLNAMSANLTCQIRDFSQTTHALVNGSTQRRVTVSASGETAELKETINKLIDRHAAPA